MVNKRQVNLHALGFDNALLVGVSSSTLASSKFHCGCMRIEFADVG
jgi:hypothetical protein